MTTKEKAIKIIQELPEDATWEDIQYQLYVVEKIQKGIERAEKEGTLSQNEVEKKFSKWTSK